MFSPPRPRCNTDTVQQVNPLQITHSVHSNLCHPCLKFHMSLQLPRLQVIQSKFLWVIRNYLRHTLTSHLHDTVNIELISVMIQHITPKCFAHCPSDPNPLLQQIGNYAIADLTIMYKKYRYKRLNTFCCNWLANGPCVFFRLSLLLFIFNFYLLLPLYKYLLKFVRGTVLLFALERAVHIFIVINISKKDGWLCTLWQAGSKKYWRLWEKH